VRLNRTFACMLSLSVISSSAVAAELKVLSVGTVGNVLREVIPVYEQDSGNRVQISFANPAAVLDRVRRGEPADIVIQAQVLWEQIEMLGRVDSTTRTSLPITTFGVGLKAGTKQIESMSLPVFLRIMQKVGSVALVDRSPATPTIMQNLGKYGVASKVEAITKLYPTGEAIAEALARAEVDLGMTTMSELVSKPGVIVLGTMPSEILSVRVGNSAAITKDAAAPQEARAFLEFLKSPAAISIFMAKGFYPN
jgi:molybdate transport system substrate-binding protein